jgi:hypothetical protein
MQNLNLLFATICFVGSLPVFMAFCSVTNTACRAQQRTGQYKLLAINC